ncbi:SCN11A [Branchiostoma lanceolatum]|uniref:SCN11A protein n=1 Tax=Branchiostoma lanceolatum TaxID=7740 RepID=A0A8J9YQK3_BRALA|nr:SCN11A [Branchiostoma lanceolatum]
MDQEDFWYRLAAAYVTDALEGRHHAAGLGTKILLGKTHAARCLKVQCHTICTGALLLTIVFHCVLSHWEPAQMVAASAQLQTWVLWGGVGCTTVYWLDTFLTIAHMTPRGFCRLPHNILHVILLLLLTSDYVIYTLCGRLIFRCLRPFLWLLRDRNTRGVVLVMAGITPDLLQFLLLTSLCALWLAAVGIHLLAEIFHSPDGQFYEGSYEGAYDHIFIAFLRTFILLAGGDYPGLMIEAYKTENTTLLYFDTVVYIGQFFAFALLVAQIYDSYKSANKKRMKVERLEERQCLVKAFDAIDFAKIGVISYQQWRRLYKELDRRATVVETIGRFKKFKELAGHDVNPGNKTCDTENEMLTLVEFLFLPDVLQFTVERKRRKELFGRRKSRLIRLQSILKGRAVFWVSTVLNLLFLLSFVVVWRGMPRFIAEAIFWVNGALLVLMLVLSLLQVAAFRRDVTRENLVAMVTELFAIGCHVSIATAREHVMLRSWTRVAAFLCMVVRQGVVWIPLSTWFHWTRRIALPYVILTLLTYVIMYVTAVIGTELFAPVSGFKPPRGFKDFDTAMLTLFQILMGSGWDSMMQHVATETSYWACAYFLLYFTLMHLLVVNVAMAIMVDLVSIIQADVSFITSLYHSL